MNPLDVRPVPPEGLGEAASVVARGMADNPHHVRDFGADPGRRVGRCERLYREVLPLIREQGEVLVASRDGRVVGGLGVLGPGRCRPSLGVQARLAGRFLARLGPGPGLATLRWMKARIGYDPSDPHWHLGPVAVEPSCQGQGVGSTLMRDVCRLVDHSPHAAAPAFLETESPRNVRFYERFGFATVGERTVLGVPTWLMLRPPPGAGA